MATTLIFGPQLALVVLALALAGGFVAYHRKSLLLWTVLSAIALAICWFTGVNQTAVIVAAAIVAPEAVFQ